MPKKKYKSNTKLNINTPIIKQETSIFNNEKKPNTKLLLIDFGFLQPDKRPKV